MNINYLTVLPKVDQNYTKNYTLMDISQENIKSVIEDKINFSSSDKNHDDFLTYEELSNIKLSVNFNPKKDKFELRRGIDLLSNESIENIFYQKGISFYTLEEELKKLDKNNNGTIDSNEVEQDFSQLAIKQERAYRAYKLNNIKEKEGEEAQNESAKKQIAALEKQIQSLKRMLSELETQKVSKPLNSNVLSQKNAVKHTTEGINNQLNIKELEATYGIQNVEEVVNVLERVSRNSGNIDNIADTVIAQTNTDISREAIVNLAQGAQAVAMSEIAVKEAQDLSAVEQFSPAATPINIDKKNIDFTISGIKQKIADMEGMKDKIMQKTADSKLKKLDITT